MKYLQVLDIETAECVKEIDITGKTECEIDRIERGVLININSDKFFTDIVEK